MKVFSCPEEVQAPKPDYRNYDPDKELARQEEHKKALAAWMRVHGWKGSRTGEILRLPMGDGYAQYMFGTGDGMQSCLIHLPYGDAYHSPLAAKLTKSEVMAKLDQEKAVASIFAKKSVA